MHDRVCEVEREFLPIFSVDDLHEFGVVCSEIIVGMYVESDQHYRDYRARDTSFSTAALKSDLASQLTGLGRMTAKGCSQDQETRRAVESL